MTCLNPEQIDILIGLMLGDGCLEKNGRNVRLRMEYSSKQKAYVSWLYEKFKNISGKEPRSVLGRHSKANKFYEKCRFYTFSLECLNDYRELFYQGGRKCIPENIMDILISPLTLAIWFMDDGHKRSDCNALRISTDSFHYEEQMRLVECLEKNFCLKSRLHKKAQAWNIYIPKSDAYKFCDLVAPHIVHSMKYKINLTP